MMGYTHATVGAAGAMSLATICGNGSTDLYVVATVAGAIGGISVDADTKDQRKNPRVTDASRSRLAVAGLLIVGVLLDYVFKFGTISNILSRQYVVLGGIMAFGAFVLVGHSSEHRTFTHSLLFIILTSICVYCICPEAIWYYCIGAILHLILDMFNNPFHNHGVYLLYPMRKGKGIALGLCKAARKANKVIYFIGISAFLIMSVIFFYPTFDLEKIITTVVIVAYMVIAMHLVRRESEKEQRHIMHMRGEI